MVEAVIETRSYRTAAEDRAVVLDHPEGRVIVVADGVGGRSNGGRAADALVASVTRRLPGQTSLHRASVWHRLLEQADADVRADGGRGETTAVVAAVTPLGLAGAAVGDSEAWHVPPAGPAVVLAGRGRRKPSLGCGVAVPEAFAVESWGGTLLVATDGLFKYADPDRILATVRQADLAAAAALVAALPSSPGGTFPDDVAVVLCRAAEPHSGRTQFAFTTAPG